MECKFCKTENPDEAVFCKKCGKRLDGIVICPNCGKQISDDDDFCMFCGANMKKHTTEVAVTVATPATPYTTASATAESGNGWNTAKKVLNYVANGIAILTAVLALIFVFFMGINATSSYGSESETITLGIKFFFKEGYSQLEESKKYFVDSSIQYSDLYKNYSYFPMVLGTTIFNATIVTVLTLAITAIVRCTKNMLGNNQVNGCNFALAAFLTFVLGAAMLMSLLNISIKTDTNDSSSAMISALYPKYGFNSPTWAFIIIGAICTFITFGCQVASHGKDLFNKSAALKCCFGVGAIVLCAVMLGVVSVPFFTVKNKEDSAGVTLYYMLSTLASSCRTKQDYDACQNASSITALIVLSFMVLAVIAIIVTVCISYNAQNMQDGKNRITLGHHVALVCLCAILLTFAILIISEMQKANIIGRTSEDFKIIYVVPIVLLVFSVISLIENIVYRALSRPKI